MIISAVKLSNFKKHGDLEVSFSEGTNVISGSNYAGKSSVLQAVLLGLWGNSAVPGATSDLIKTGYSAFTVVLSLSNGFKIERSPKNSKVLDSFGNVVVRTHTEVNRYVEELLGVSRKTFLKVFSSEQGSPQALLSMEGAELQRFIEVCLGVDVMDRVLKIARHKATQATAKAEVLEEQCVPIEQARSYRDEISRLTKYVNDAALELRLTKTNKERHKEYLKKLTLEKEQEQESEKAWSSYLGSLLVLKKSLEDKQKESVPIFVDVTEDSQELTQLRELYMRQFSLHSSLERDRATGKAAQMKLKDFEAELKGIVLSGPVDYGKKERALQEVTTALVIKAKEVTDLEVLLASSVCVACNRPLTDAVKREAAEEALLNLKDEVNDLTGIRVPLVAQLHYLKERAQEEQEKETKVEALTDIIQKTKQQIVSLSSDQQCLPEFLSGVMQKNLGLGEAYIRKTCSANAVAERHKRELLKAETLLAKLVQPTFPMPEEDSNVQALLDKGQETLFSLHGAEAALKSGIDKAQRESARLSLASEAAEKVAKQLATYKKELNDLVKVADSVSSVRKKVVKDGFDVVLHICSGFVSSCTGGDVSEVVLTDSGIRYKEQGISRGTINASGAQKTLIGLGMKLGLAQIVPSVFAALILDEVSADMDEEVSLACLTALGSYAKQVIVVSHRALDAADNPLNI